MKDIEAYYKSHGKKVYYYLLSMVHDDNLAEELTQETFYQAMKTINKYRGDCKPSVWLCQIAKHVWYRYLEKNKKYESISMEELKIDIMDSYDLNSEVMNRFDKLAFYKKLRELDDNMKECKDCNKEFQQMIKPMSVSDKEKQNNTKEVHYFKKCKKKYSTVVKLLIIISVICAVLFAGLVITLTLAYHQQYNNNGVSNYLCISIEANESINFIGEHDGYKIYTYKLEEAYFIDFFANRIEIKDALEKGKISLKDMTKHLELVDEENGNKIYEFENYQIIFSKEICVIAPLSIKGEAIIQAVEDYVAE